MSQSRTLFLLLLGLHFTPFLGAQQWEDIGPVSLTSRYEDLYFHDTNLGWAVNNTGEIFRTADGGNTWTLLYHQPDLYLRSVDFIDAEVGFVGSLNGVFLKTTDGGDSWLEIQNDIPGPMAGICGLSHVGDHVFGAGIFYYPAYFIKSTNRGEDWTFTDLSEFADGLVECHFINQDTGFLAGIKESSGGVILKTTNGGTSWTVVCDTENGAEYIWKLDFVTDQVAYGAVESFSGGPVHIVKTLDGGDNWSIKEVFSSYLDLQGIGFINEQVGWVGPRIFPLYETLDGGETWNPTNLFPNINRFFRLNSGLMFAGGSTIYRYTDTTAVISHIEPVIPEAYAVLQVSPNPFQNQIKVTLHLKRSTNARLDLFSSAGENLSNLQAGPLGQGQFDFTIEPAVIDKLPNGTYYVVLRANEGFISKPVIKGK